MARVSPNDKPKNKKMSNAENSEDLTSDDPYWFAEAYSVRMTIRVESDVSPHAIRDHIVEYVTADLNTRPKCWRDLR